MPLSTAKDLGVQITTRSDIMVRGVDGKPLSIEGELCVHWHKVVVMSTGSYTLISNKDQKYFLLLDDNYPRSLKLEMISERMKVLTPLVNLK